MRLLLFMLAALLFALSLVSAWYWSDSITASLVAVPLAVVAGLALGLAGGRE